MEHSTPSSHTRPMSGESQAPLISNSEHISSSSPGEISPNSPYFASQAMGDLLRVPSSSPVPGHDSAAPPALGEGWSRDWLGIVAAVVAILVLIAWIIAAAILVAVECFLPLDWFGGGSVTADSYNVLISAASNVVSLAVGACLARGFQALLGYLVLRNKGIDGDTYHALVRCANRDVVYRLRWTAVGAFAVFLVSQLIQPATQAAFGSSVAQQNISVPLNVSRFSDNPSLLTVDAIPDVANNVNDVNLGDTSFNVDATYSNTIGNGSNVRTRVFPAFESSSPHEPLFSTLNLLRSQVGDGALYEYLTLGERDRVDASSNTVVHAPVEGYYADVACVNASSTVTLISNFTWNGAWTTLNLGLPCGNVSVVYPRNASYDVTVDSYACQDGSNTVFFWGVDTFAGTPSYLYSCGVSAWSSPARVSITPRNGDLLATVDWIGTWTPLNSGNVVSLLGVVLLNKWGSRGWNEVARWLQSPLRSEPYTTLDEPSRRRFLNILLTTITKSILADLSTLLSRSSTPRNSTLQDAQYEVTVLKIHLSSSQLAWFAVPILLLSLLAPLAFFLAVHPFSAVDLTDPLDTALIALSSPASSNVKAFAKGQNRKSTRIRLGELNEGPHRPTSMGFKAAGEKSGLGGLEKPRRMSTVV